MSFILLALMFISLLLIFFAFLLVWKRKTPRRVKIANVLYLSGESYLFLHIFPFIWMVSTFLKSAALTFSLPPRFFIFPIQWKNYKACLNYPSFRFTLFARNTLYLCILTVLGTLPFPSR